MTSPTKFDHVTQIVCRCGHLTKVWHFHERRYNDVNAIGIWSEKPIFLRGADYNSMQRFKDETPKLLTKRDITMNQKQKNKK